MKSAMHSPKDDKTIINISIINNHVEKGMEVLVWDHEDYLKEANKQLNNEEINLEVPNNPSALVSTIPESHEKIGA